MGVEVIDRSSELNNVLLEGAIEHELDGEQQFRSAGLSLDARRRLEDKIEEMRLRRETQEFDFDI